MRKSVFVDAHGDRPGVKNVAILVTSSDGNVGVEAEGVEKNGLKFVKDKNVHLTVIGPHIEKAVTLKKLSGGNYFLVDESYNDLKSITQKIILNIQDGLLYLIE